MLLSFIDTLDTNYVRTSWAKGSRSQRVIGKHALKNAAIPAVTVLGLQLSTLLGGAVVIELIFAWPGLGRELLQAILELDIPLILGVAMVSACAIAIANLIVDVVQLWLDPRLREPA